MRGEERTWTWIAALAVAAGVLRAIGLNDGLWFDEIATLIDSVRRPIGSIVTEFPTNNQHSFYSVLAHASIVLFGEHAWTLRLPAFLFGVATVPILYLFAREVCDRTEAVLACLLLATSYHHIWFSQNARGYSALAFLIVVCSWLLLRLLRAPRRADAIWYACAAALGTYTHLTMIFAALAHAMIAAFALAGTRGSDRVPRLRLLATAFVLAGVFSFLLYSPVLLDVKQFFVDKARPVAVATPGWAAIEMIKGLQIGLGTGAGAVVAAVLLLAGFWSYLRQSARVAGLFVLPGITTVGAALALGRPIFPRFVFFLIAFALLIAVRGAFVAGRMVSTTRGAALGAGLVVLTAGVSIVAAVSNYRYPKQDFEGAMRFVDERRMPDEQVVTAGLMASVVYTRYYGRDWKKIESAAQLEEARSQGRRVWVLYTLARYIEHDTPDLMQLLRAECAKAAVFRGTVGNGEVTVCTAPARPEPR